jgi:hypothetical protein
MTQFEALSARRAFPASTSRVQDAVAAHAARPARRRRRVEHAVEQESVDADALKTVRFARTAPLPTTSSRSPSGPGSSSTSASSARAGRRRA